MSRYPHSAGEAPLRNFHTTRDSTSKLLFHVLREVSREWKMPPREWNAARAQFAILFGDRFVAS